MATTASVLLFVSTLSIILTLGCSLPITQPAQKPVCQKDSMHQYILTSFDYFHMARNARNCSQLLEQKPELNHVYCECNSIVGSPGSKSYPPVVPTPTPTPEPVVPTVIINNTDVDNDNVTTVNESTTANETKSRPAPKDETTAQSDDSSSKGCWFTFLLNLKEGKQEPLGGDFSFYVLPIQTRNTEASHKVFVAKIYDDQNTLIQSKQVAQTQKGHWETLHINDFAEAIPFGSRHIKIRLQIVMDNEKVLSCKETEKYFIVDCSIVKPPHKDASYNLMPMITVLAKRTSSLFETLFGRKRRETAAEIINDDKSKTECTLKKQIVKLSEAIKLKDNESLASADYKIEIASCTSENTSVNCMPKSYKTLSYIVKSNDDESRFEIKELPIINKC